ncbi:MAG: Na+/H+ antiporter NhaA [Steroidobacteraceae bacterium]
MSQRSAPPSRLSELVFRSEAGSSLLLLAATIAALLWANSSWEPEYQRLWALPLTLGTGALCISGSLHFWVNEGLMAVFFLAVGLEIHREFIAGDLRSVRLAALPLVSALGGVILPALIYLALNPDASVRRGWAIPTATDIAFAIAVFSFLRRRAHPALRALLLAIAVIDDIVAILVIAFFYADGIGIGGLGIAGAGIGAGLLLRVIGSRWVVLYALPGVAIWIGLLHAGIHPALTGVILGLLIPGGSAVHAEDAIRPWVEFGIMPLFALANAGVALHALTSDLPTAVRLAAGIAAGLVIGKPIGIILAAAIGIKLGWCALPAGVDLRRFAVVGCLGGIGFTMSLFVCNLAFTNELLATAKLAVLIGSTLAAIGGLCVGRWILPAAITRPR